MRTGRICRTSRLLGAAGSPLVSTCRTLPARPADGRSSTARAARLRPPGRGAERRPREHDAGVRGRRRPRLPLPRDRRPRHGRRRAARLPRRRARPGDRPHRRDRRAARGARWREARVDGTRADPAARGPPRGVARTLRVNIDPKHDARRRAAGRRRSAHRAAVDRVCVRRRSATTAWPRLRGCSGPGCARRSARSASLRLGWCRLRRCRRASSRRRAPRCRTAIGGTRARRPSASCRGPPPRACRCTCGRSTTQAEMDAPARPRRRRDHDRPPGGAEGRAQSPRPVGRVGRVELPLTPLDFLARARRLFPDRVGVVAGRRRRCTYAEFAARCDRPGRALLRRARRAARRPGGVARAATPTSCSRRTSACCSPAPCSCR